MTPALSPIYSYALPDTDEIYTLGPTEAPLLSLNLTDEHGCSWVVDEPEGWDSPEFDTPIDPRSDGHGGFAGATYMRPRTLAFDGAVSCPTPLDAKRARGRLLEALAAAGRAPVLYTQHDDDPAKSLWCRVLGKPRAQIVDGYAVVFAFTLIAEYPLKEGEAGTYGPARLPSSAGQAGRVYPRVYPYSYSTGVSGDRIDVVVVPNGGNEPAHALYEVTGPVPQPRIEAATGEFVGITADLGAADVLEVDTRTGTVRVNGVNRADVLAAGSTYPRIPAGGTEVRLRSQAGGTDPAAALHVTTAPTWH